MKNQDFQIIDIRGLKEEIDELKKSYLSTQSVIMPGLYLLEKKFGWITQEAILVLSKLLSVPEATIKGVVTFYTMYRNRPLGRHIIQICTNVSCMLMGAERLVDFINQTYGIKSGETTPDGRFSLIIMECIGACSTSPAMLINNDFHCNLSIESIENIIESYK